MFTQSGGSAEGKLGAIKSVDINYVSSKSPLCVITNINSSILDFVRKDRYTSLTLIRKIEHIVSVSALRVRRTRRRVMFMRTERGQPRSVASENESRESW